MARQAFTLGGAIVGSFFGQPQLGFVIGSLIGNYVDPQVVKTPRIKDLPVQTADEGGYRQVVYGTCWINETNIIDFSDVRRVVTEERQGKGGGPVVESERLYRTYAIGLGEPLEAIRVIRRDGKIVYDVRPGSAILSDSGAFADRFRFYSGAEDQLPDPDLEAIHGVGNTPYYRGTAYLVFPNDDLTDTQGRIPTYEVEAIKSGAIIGASDGLLTESIAYTGSPPDITQGDLVGWPSGTDLVRVAPGGLYAAGSFVGDNTANRFTLKKLNTTTGNWDTLPAPADLPTLGPYDMAWSNDGNYLACSVFTASPNNVLIYARSGDTFTKVVQSTFLPNNGYFVAWSDDDTMIAFGNGSSAAGIYVFDIFAGVLSNARAGNTGLAGCQPAFSPNGLYVAAANRDSGLYVFGVGPSSLTLVDSAGAALDPIGWAGCWWTDSGIITVADQGAPGYDYVQCWDFDGITLSLAGVPATQPGALCLDSSLDATKRYLAVASSDGSLYVYDLLTFSSPVLDDTETYSGGVDTVSWVDQQVPTIQAGQTILQLVIEDICDRCGLISSDYDMSPLSNVVDGVTLGGGYNGADAVTLFMPAYFFDIVQPDKTLTAVIRGGASIDAVTGNDFVEEPDENILRGQEIEVPRALLLKYLNPAQNYAAPAAVVSRTSPDIRVSGEATAELPISFDETGAIRVADRMLKVMWEDLNGEITFSLPSGPWAWLTPTDILTLSLRGGVYRIRVEKVEEAAGVLKVSARRDRQSAYTSNLTAPSLPAPTTPPPAQPGDTTFVVMNLPALIDEDDRLGVYLAMTGGENTSWAGAQVAYRRQGATDWVTVGNFTRRATMGELLANLPYASPYYTDTTNPLQVSLVYAADQLETLTYEQFLSEGNPAAIVKSDYTAEIVQFRYAQDDSNTDWTLTTLLRGRLNTEPQTHLAGATFVMLEGSIFIPLPSSLIGQTLEFRVTSLGNSTEGAPTQTLVWNPVYSQYEFPVYDLTLQRSGGVISGEWSPWQRFGSDVYPVASANFTGYRVTLTDGTVTNIFTVIDPEFSTSDAAYTGTITVTVEALNRYTGAGPSVSESI